MGTTANRKKRPCRPANAPVRTTAEANFDFALLLIDMALLHDLHLGLPLLLALWRSCKNVRAMVDRLLKPEIVIRFEACARDARAPTPDRGGCIAAWVAATQSFYLIMVPASKQASTAIIQMTEARTMIEWANWSWRRVFTSFCVPCPADIGRRRVARRNKWKASFAFELPKDMRVPRGSCMESHVRKSKSDPVRSFCYEFIAKPIAHAKMLQAIGCGAQWAAVVID